MRPVSESVPSLASLSTDITLAAADGYPLGATIFEPDGPIRGVVLIAGATAVRQRYYAPFARHLATSGLATVTYDYRGIGRSRPAVLADLRATMTDWARLDTAAALDLAGTTARGAPIVYIGHSFGGQILALLDDLPQRVKGALLVGSQLGSVEHFPIAARPKLFLLWNVLIPAVTSALGYFPGSLGLVEDLPGGVASEWARWCRHPEYVLGHDPRARHRLASFDRPVLAYGFSDDDFAPRSAVAALTRELRSADLTTRFVQVDGSVPVGHFGFFREASASSLWPEALAYLDAVVEGRPSVTDGGRVTDGTGVLVPRPSCEISMDDVLADLAYGRALRGPARLTRGGMRCVIREHLASSLKHVLRGETQLFPCILGLEPDPWRIVPPRLSASCSARPSHSPAATAVRIPPSRWATAARRARAARARVAPAHPRDPAAARARVARPARAARQPARPARAAPRPAPVARQRARAAPGPAAPRARVGLARVAPRAAAQELAAPRQELEAPRLAQEAPRLAQEAPRLAQEAPRLAQEEQAPRAREDRPRAAGARQAAARAVRQAAGAGWSGSSPTTSRESSRSPTPRSAPGTPASRSELAPSRSASTT